MTSDDSSNDFILEHPTPFTPQLDLTWKSPGRCRGGRTLAVDGGAVPTSSGGV